MSCPVPNQRRVVVTKFITTGAVPTVPTVADCDLWNPRDIEEAEFVVNTKDKRVYTRAGNSIIELTNQSGGGTIAGTIAATQVAYGSAADTITGDSNFVVTSSSFNLQRTVTAGFTGKMFMNPTTSGPYSIPGMGMVWTSSTASLYHVLGDGTSLGLNNAVSETGYYDGSNIKNSILIYNSGIKVAGNSTTSSTEGWLHVSKDAASLNYEDATFNYQLDVSNGGVEFHNFNIPNTNYYLPKTSTPSLNYGIIADGAGNSEWGAIVLPGVITSSGLTMATARILGRTTAGTGAVEEISIGAGLSLAAGTLSATGSSVALSAITAATGTNTIDNLLNNQTWNWSTLSTQTAIDINANSLTTGSILRLQTSGLAALNSTNGLLYVANTSAVTNGILARFQSNSTSGSGLTVLANGNVGVETASPAQLFQAGAGAGGGAGTKRIRIAGENNAAGLAFVDMFVTGGVNANKGFVFDNGAGADGMYVRSAGSSPYTIDYIPSTAAVSCNLNGKNSAGQTLINLSWGGASNASLIDLYRGATNTIRLVDNNLNDSFFNTGKSFCIGTTAAGTSAANNLVFKDGTAPTTNPTNTVHVYAADIVAGHHALHIENENATTIKLYQETTAVTTATYAAVGGTTIQTNDTFDGYTLQQVVKALRNQGFLA